MADDPPGVAPGGAALDFRVILEEIEAGLDRLEFNEIKRRLEPVIIRMAVQAPIVDAGAFFYRGRLLRGDFRKSDVRRLSDVSHPPPERTKLGRVNNAGAPMFYCTVAKENVIPELPELAAGDEFVISIWQSTARMFFNHIGYTSEVFKSLGIDRALPKWAAPPDGATASVTMPLAAEIVDQALASDPDRNRQLRAILSRMFARRVPDEARFQYKLTAAIGELHLGELHHPPEVADAPAYFAGVIYPSIQSGVGDNFAIIPRAVADSLKFRKAIHYRVDGIDGERTNLSILDVALDAGDGGVLNWLGRNARWTVAPGRAVKCTSTAGADERGDYLTAPDGNRMHWVATDRESGDRLDEA